MSITVQIADRETVAPHTVEVTDTKDNDTKPELSATLPFPKSAFRGVLGVYLEAVKGRNAVCNAYHFAVLTTALGSTAK